MTLDVAAAAAGVSDGLLTGAVFRARDISSIDPRLNLVGDDLIWVLRSLVDDSSTQAPADQSRAAIVSLVDDSTERVLAIRDLAVGDGFRPARLLVQSTRPTRDGNEPDENHPFFRVTSEDGHAVHESRVSGGLRGTARLLTYGPDPPLLLAAGTYTVSWWLASDGDSTPPTPACSMEYTMAAGDDVTAEAAFPSVNECTTSTLAAPTPGNGR